MAYFTSKFKIKNSKSPAHTRKWNSVHGKSSSKRKLFKLNLSRYKKAFYVGCGFLVIVLFIGALYGFGWLQSLTEQLPSPDKPFGVQNAASEIYDRNGKLLYRVYGNDNRDPISIKDVPPLMKYSVLAAEDIGFYQHGGVDIPSVIRCAILNIAKQSACGGSTITQQLIKQTALTNERSWERKIKEVILALEIEKERSKDQILEMYLNVIPEGSNIYGIKSAAQEYFGKDLKDLNLAQYAVLASIPQDPNNLSPTRSSNANSEALVKDRQMYVLGEMEKYMDQINAGIKADTGSDANLLTKQMIDDARNFTLVYSNPTKSDELKAPHFVFFVEKLLQERGYNNGEPFTMDSLETQGYKIYTTLDLDYQQIAEEQVKKGVDVYGKKYGADNAALVALNPNNGEIMAMVGSYDYFGASKPAGCTGSNCTFNPEVNIIDSLQSYGSSMKPIVYYDAIEKGVISAGSIIPDIPIKIGNYKPKNFGSVFTGIRPARIQLTDSQNIPAITLLDTLGVDNFVTELKRWGYSTLTDPRGYGPSLAVGGADIKLIDHAQAYGILATEGTLYPYEGVLKIVDRNGNVVFNYTPQGQQIADPRAAYIVNNMLNANNGGPGLNSKNGGPDYKGWDARDIAGKTGTSEDFKETLFCTYTPEMVVVGWLGNNNNKPMSSKVSGFGSARPWIAEFMLRIGKTFPPTPFNRPAGVVDKSNCDGQGSDCTGVKSDLGLVDVNPPSYVTVKQYTVCTDEPDHLARQLDIDLGKSMTVTVKSYTEPDTKLQSFLDTYVSAHPEYGGVVPTLPCDINRSPNGTLEPWAVISSPTNGQVVGTTVDLQYNAFTANANAVISKTEVYLDGNGPILQPAVLPYSGSLSLGVLSPGNHALTIKTYDNAGQVGTNSVTIIVPEPPTAVPTETPTPIPTAILTPTPTVKQKP